MAALRRGQPAKARPRATWRDDLIAALFAGWMAFGLFVDGWAHINLRQGRLGPFFTPWHGILYAGFTALALWILSRNQRRGSFSIDNVPIGYGLSLVGMVVTTVAVAGDAAWHTIFGEEVDVARLLAPFHLVLFTGAIILAASPLRSAWLKDDGDETPSSRTFLPALVSLMLVSGLVAFFMQFVSPFINWLPVEVRELAEASPFHEAEQINGLAQVLIWNLVLIGPVLLVLRRWRPPFGSMTLLLGSVVGMISALNEFSLGALVLAVVAGGFAADVAIARTWSKNNRIRVMRVTGVVVPVVLWLSYFACMKLFYGLDGTGWPLEIWTGAVFIAGLTGWGLSYLMVPTPAGGAASAPMSAQVAAAAAAPAPAPAQSAASLLPFLQEFADLVEAAENAASYGEAARQTRDAALVLRAAAERLPANLKPRFPMEEELARLEMLAAAASSSHGAFRESVRDASGILAGVKRGLAIEDGPRLLLLNLTARAERVLTHQLSGAPDRGALAAAVADDDRRSALVDATMRNLHHQIDEARQQADAELVGAELDLRDGSLRLDLASEPR